LKIEQNDTIAIVDGRPELKFIKGQNQRTFEIGTFPRNILEVLRFNRNGTLNTISRPLHGTFQHTAHGSSTGTSWGSPSFLDSSYNNNNGVQLRQKSADQVSKNTRQQKAVSEHFAKEKKSSASKQFSYNKLINEHRVQHDMYQQQQQQQQKSQTLKPARPPAPSMQQKPTEGILIDLSPEEMRTMSVNLSQGVLRAQTSCLLDEPIDIPTERIGLEEEHRLPPPPYNLPPQYSLNTVQFDPFDTTHVVENLYANSAMVPVPYNSTEPIYCNNSAVGTNNTFVSQNDPLNELLSASLASLSITTNNDNNINGQTLTPKRVEKQMLAEQLQGAKENNFLPSEYEFFLYIESS
jgi:GTPase binding